MPSFFTGHGLAPRAAGRALAPFLFLLVAGTLMLAGCAHEGPAPGATPPAQRLAALPPADVLLLGEQHDAPEHHVIERETVQALADRGRLAALALEMAEAGHSTAHLPADASEAQAQAALGWDDQAWPWADYGPAVMSAVRAGVPVLGANLPQTRMKDAMTDVSLDAQLNAEARLAQQQAVRDGHCDLLPAARIVPMTRIQIARDRAMAQTVLQARVPGKTVLLITGAGHAVRTRGVPQHLPTNVQVVSVQLLAATPPGGFGPGDFDRTWQTPPLPEKDYCAALKVRRSCGSNRPAC